MTTELVEDKTPCPNCRTVNYTRFKDTYQCHCMQCFLVFDQRVAQKIAADRDRLDAIRLRFVKDDPWTMDCDSYEWLIERLDAALEKPGQYLKD